MKKDNKNISKNNNINKNFNIGNIDVKKCFFPVIMFIVITTILYYMLGPSEGYLHSDCVDTMTWAWASVESGDMFSETFCYPYLLPFGATFLVFPFVKIFGFTMLAYRLSMIVFLIIFALALYFVVRGLGWNRNTALFVLSVELIMVSSSVKLRELFWEHIIHYSLGAMLSFVLIALLFRFMKAFEDNKYSFKGNNKVTIFAGAIFIWTLLGAFDGLTVLALSFIPVLGAIVLTAILDNNHKIISDSNKTLGLSFVIILAGTLIGTLIFTVVAGDINTSYGDASSVISAPGEWSNNALKFLQHWTSLLGAEYKAGESITRGVNILAAIKMAGSLLLFVTPVYAIIKYKKYNRNERIFIFYHWLMSAFVLYGYVFGNLSSVNWRLSPIICSAVVVCFIVWKKLWEHNELKRMSVVVSSLVILSCVVTVCQIWAMPADYGRDNDHHKAIELLERNNLEYGYATYWNANILTLLSSSSVKVRDVNFDEPEPRTGWLNSDNAWFRDQPEANEYFILLTNSEYETMCDENYSVLDNVDKVIKEGNWVVVVLNENIF